MRSKLSVTVYLFLALYGSTTLQSRLFLKKYQELSLQVEISNRSIPSTHTERKITVRSHKHSFTPYPSLSPYGQRRNKYTCCAWAGGTFFPVVLLCQFFGFWREIGFGVTYLRI